MTKLMCSILFILASTYASVTFSYHQCNKDNDIHCTYYVGDNSKNNGRYIKTTLISNKKISHIHCTRGGLINIIPNKFGNDWGVGKRKFIYEQCLDQECRKSKFLASDEFSIIKDGNKFKSLPQIFNVRILSDYGKACTA